MRVPVQLGLLGGLASMLLTAGFVVLSGARRSPKERERQRRLCVNQRGRMGDATVTDATENIIYYSYSLRGVDYTASQDVSTLRDHLPPDPAILIGPVTLKYLGNNPENSILICEDWSGFRKQFNLLRKGA